MISIRKNTTSLILFVLAVMAGGIAIGILTAPGPWYADLVKPAFNPPNWIFAPVWTLLYLCIAIAGWRIWQIEPAGLPMKAWFAQMLLNFIWSPLFFVAHRMDLALGVILLMLALIVTFIYGTWRTDRPAALLFVPYAAWVAFASVLNGSLLALNPSVGG
ncbi:TspO/MBR family protein [Roseobacter sp. N2S]|uniref:TspO/MBR family protein n=1 Tax=Roseobacter sp. N2S TaxID=2663844 RepID=UPI00285A5513|nr:TspO/MBR family protein [Roseobacter sp. N2S]MDR6263332.1 tryptophan-rich sensory protein [Roseobacter sp. N2S]